MCWFSRILAVKEKFEAIKYSFILWVRYLIEFKTLIEFLKFHFLFRHEDRILVDKYIYDNAIHLILVYILVKTSNRHFMYLYIMEFRVFIFRPSQLWKQFI